MSHLPYIKFFPDNWMHDAGLRRCAPVSRAVWLDLICLMHQGEPYGYLRDSTGPMPVKFLANWCGITSRTLAMAIDELFRFNVPSRAEDGAIYCRRMVRNEEVRQARAMGGRKSLDNPNVPRTRISSRISLEDTVKDTLKDILEGRDARTILGDGPHGNGMCVVSSSESQVSTKPPPCTREAQQAGRVHEFLEPWPRCADPDSAVRAWLSCIPDDAATDAAFACRDRYLASDEVARGVVMEPWKFIYVQSQNGWTGKWPPAKSRDSPKSKREQEQDHVRAMVLEHLNDSEA